MMAKSDSNVWVVIISIWSSILTVKQKLCAASQPHLGVVPNSRRLYESPITRCECTDLFQNLFALRTLNRNEVQEQ